MNKIIITLILVSNTFVSKAQELVEWGITVNSANYVGDLKESLSERGNIGDLTTYYIKNSGLALGGFYRKNVTEHFSYRAGLNWARISGGDAEAKVLDNKNRNLSFRSDIIELNALAEINIKPLGFDTYTYTSTPYIFGGISIFHMNPKALYKGTWYELHQLGTEGQNQTNYQDKKSYSLTQIAVPLGVGYKFSPSSTLRIGIEAGYRITFTDYLDDVSGKYVDNDLLRVTKGNLAAALADRKQELNPTALPAQEGDKRGSAKTNDGYFFVGFTVSKIVWGNNCPKF